MTVEPLISTEEVASIMTKGILTGIWLCIKHGWPWLLGIIALAIFTKWLEAKTKKKKRKRYQSKKK